MTDHDLDEQLRTMMNRRAADIRQAPSIEFSSAGKGRTRMRVAPFVVAAAVAAVVVAAGGTVVGIRSVHRPTTTNPAATAKPVPTPSPTPSQRNTCVPVKADTAWQAPIGQGTKVPLDHPDNQVISVNASTGEYLLLQSTPSTSNSAAVFGQATIAVFRGATGQDVEVLPPGSTDVPTADPAGAIASGYIAYGLAHPQNAGTYYKVLVYNRATRATTTVAQLSDSALASGQIFRAAPVVFGHAIYWIQSLYRDRSTSVLKSYDLQTGAQGSTPVPGASSLLDYGIGLATVAGFDTESAFTTRVGAALPAGTLESLRGASSYSFNATAAGRNGAGSLVWIKASNADGKAVTRYYTMADVSRAGLTFFETSLYGFDTALGTGEFMTAYPVGTGSGDPALVLDSRDSSGQFHQLPTGDELQAVVGDTAIFGTGSSKLGGTGLVLVPVASLPRRTAGC